jgi:hypothetical protein
MIPSIVTDTSITFIARGQAFTLAADHVNFDKVRGLLALGTDDADALIHLTDIRMAVADATAGAVQLTEEGAYMNGEALAPEWAELAANAPYAMKVLTVQPGDKVLVQGDEDAPDGIYIVGAADTDDAKQCVYVESGDDEGFFGFIQNVSIKEIIRE